MYFVKFASRFEETYTINRKFGLDQEEVCINSTITVLVGKVGTIGV